MKLSKIFLVVGIPLAVIFGLGRILNNESPDYYMYMGVLGIVFVILSFAIRWFKGNQK
ncbi:hypothetical protein [Paenibacillus harenae]|uniref:hypothetical protein n=1 Tax=Paenibacillus harenae TaxID=306543 RepID=UPI0012ECA48C|nr:hypothetical protein [Paenibacillus harenae]